MKKYSVSLANSGQDLGVYNLDDLYQMLNSNRADYDGVDFDAETGSVELTVSNPDDLDYIENITVVW